jgi:hypothetical protein
LGKTQGKPEIYFPTTTIDCGEIPEGPYHFFSFPFENSGNSPLIIENVKSSCGCVLPAFPRNKILQPHQKDTIGASYWTEERKGHFVKTLTVFTNDSLHPIKILHLKGKVIHFAGKLWIIDEKGERLKEDTYSERLQLIAGEAKNVYLRLENRDTMVMNLKISTYNQGHFFTKERETEAKLSVLNKVGLFDRLEEIRLLPNEIAYLWLNLWQEDKNLPQNGYKIYSAKIWINEWFLPIYIK